MRGGGRERERQGDFQRHLHLATALSQKIKVDGVTQGRLRHRHLALDASRPSFLRRFLLSFLCLCLLLSLVHPLPKHFPLGALTYILYMSRHFSISYIVKHTYFPPIIFHASSPPSLSRGLHSIPLVSNPYFPPTYVRDCNSASGAGRREGGIDAPWRLWLDPRPRPRPRPPLDVRGS